MKFEGTLQQVIKAGEEALRIAGIDNPAFDSFELMSMIMGIDRSYYFLHGNDLVAADVCAEFEEMIARRADHVPLQHITGYAGFWRHRFHVNEHVLVPRQDTEILVTEALTKIDTESTVLDMCTGSGCIIISLALETHFKKGLGVDISREALKVAALNKAELAADNVEFIESDLFAGIPADIKFDVIVSNPPYIRTEDIAGLDEEVRSHDPLLALDGHDDGLFFYKEITNGATFCLKQGGWLIYETGYDQAEDVTKIMSRCGFTDIATVKDLAGLDRVVLGRKL